MKIRNTILFALLAIVGLASCEMKEELWGQETNPDEVGLLNVGVAVSSLVNDVPVTTKANSEDVPVTSPISAEGYKIELLNADGTTVKSFTYESDMEPVEVPTGDYTLYAHMDKLFEDEMTEPYYGGRESVSIKKGITTEASVTCKMENTKIQINYPDTFLQTFKTWTIVITDNNGNSVTFTQENTNPEAVYWRIGEDVKKITINVTATTKTGERVSDSRNVTKPADSDSEYWLGNDALTITVEPGEKKPVDNPDQPAEPEDPDTDPDEPEDPDPTPDPDPEPEPDDSSTVSGIEIKVEGIFGDTASDVAVEVPTMPGDEEDTDDNEEEQKPEEPGDNEEEQPDEVAEPSVTFPNKSYTLPGDQDKDATAIISTPAGLQSVKVQIVAGNDTFASIVAQMFGAEPFELVGNTTLETVLTNMGISLPIAGEDTKEYKFPVQKFFTLLMDEQMSGGATTEPDGHVFKITVTDLNGKPANNSLSVIVE